jgi:hypothetical protein
MSVFKVPGLARLLEPALATVVALAAEEQPSQPLSFDDVFIVKYSARAGEQASLGLHVDGSAMSFQIALNSESETSGYSGGGIYLQPSDCVIGLAAGEAVSFPGQLLHGGAAIRSGVRYILVGFGRTTGTGGAGGSAAMGGGQVYDQPPAHTTAGGGAAFTVADRAPWLPSLEESPEESHHYLSASVTWTGCRGDSLSGGEFEVGVDSTVDDVGHVWLRRTATAAAQQCVMMELHPQTSQIALPLPRGFVAAHRMLLFIFPPHHTYTAAPLVPPSPRVVKERATEEAAHALGGGMLGFLEL